MKIDDPNISGYAIYENGKCARVVIVNLGVYFTNASEPRKSRKITFAAPAAAGDGGKGPGAGATSVSVKRLKIGHADDLRGLTWAGQTYETPDALVSGKVLSETLPFEHGVDVSQTEAALITFNYS